MDHSARCRGTVEPVQSAALLLLQTSFPLGGTTALSSLLFYVFTGPLLGGTTGHRTKMVLSHVPLALPRRSSLQPPPRHPGVVCR